jgi:hypothetical protein
MRLSSNLAKANYSNAMDAHNSTFYAFQMCFGGSGVAGRHADCSSDFSNRLLDCAFFTARQASIVFAAEISASLYRPS